MGLAVDHSPSTSVVKSESVFICTICDAEVSNPEYRRTSFFSFQRGRGWWYPVCPSGHPLRSLVIGNLKPSSLLFGFVRGFGLSLFLLLLAAVKFIDRVETDPRLVPFAVWLSVGILAIYGLIALAWAWSWAERKGPTGRLAERSAGVAFGHLLPAFAVGFVLYAGWLDGLAERIASTLR